MAWIDLFVAISYVIEHASCSGVNIDFTHHKHVARNLIHDEQLKFISWIQI